MSNIDFPDWLIGELDSRGWAQSDLARAAGTNPSTISHLVNRTRFPGNEMCQAIAKAFGYPPVVVFRAAGLLPERSEVDEETEKMMYLFEQLSEDDQEALINMAQFPESDGRSCVVGRRCRRQRPAQLVG